MGKVLVAGVNGFVGHHVATLLHEQSIDVLGIGNQPGAEPHVADVVSEYVSVDLTDPDAVKNLDLRSIDAIINLAGLAKVGESHGQGDLYNHVNVAVHTTLYEEGLNQHVSPRIVAISSGAVYDSTQAMPITEASKLITDDKTNEYVISKKHAEIAILKLRDRGLPIVVARPFNHIGPGQMPGFLVPDLAIQIEQFMTDFQSIKVGNLETRRDFTDVRDVARAYFLLATASEDVLKHPIYNICSGRSIAGREILDLLTKTYGIKNPKIEIDRTRLRTHEVMDIYGSYNLLHKTTGWQPTIPIEQTIQDFVAWRKNLKN